MNRVYKLHELIEMAERGDKFEAESEGKILTQEIILNPIYAFPISSITADWTVTFERESRGIWVSTYEDGSLKPNHFKTQNEASLYGKPIKFIEVLEE